jgi:hypothetical protein
MMNNCQCLALAAALAGSTLMYGQTVFTPGTAIPAFGDHTYTWYQTQGEPAVPIDTNSTVGTWDFSSLVDLLAFEYAVTIAPASNTPHEALAPGADVAWIFRAIQFDDYHYFKNGPDSLVETEKVTDIVDDGVYTFPVCQQLRFVYPVQVGDAFTEQENAECPPTGSLWRRKVIAAGTLVTSIGTFNDLVLVKYSGSAVDEPDTEIFLRYLWFLPGNALFPFAEYNPLGIPTFKMFVLTPVLGIEEASGMSTLVLSPNPAADAITVSTRNGRALGELRIHAADGRVLREVGRVATDLTTVDVQGLKPGVYMVSSNDGAVPAVLRFVKE